MTRLTALQNEFQRFVLEGDDTIAARVADDRAPAQRRLAIYYQAYRLRLLEALGSDYPALAKVCGEERFAELGRAYVDAMPSSFRNLRWYGDSLSEFLADRAPWRGELLLSELARFEWALAAAFDAEDVACLTFDDLAAVPPERWPGLRFVLHPSARLVRLRTNAPAFRKAADQEQQLPALIAGSEAIPWLIWRKERNSLFRSLDEAEAWALDAVRDGTDFAAICDGLCEWTPAEEAPLKAAQLLRAWIDDQLIARARSSSGAETRPAT